MTRALVTGGAGFIGSHVADELVGMRHEVHVVNDLTSGFRDNVPGAASFHEGWVSDPEVVPGLFDARSITVPAARNQLFNVGADVPHSVDALTGHVARAIGAARVAHPPPRHDVVDACSSHEEARRLLSCEARADLQARLDGMASWVREQWDRKSKPFADIGISRALQSSWLEEE